MQYTEYDDDNGVETGFKAIIIVAIDHILSQLMSLSRFYY